MAVEDYVGSVAAMKVDAKQCAADIRSSCKLPFPGDPDPLESLAHTVGA
jgi:hypothetical protein